MYKAMSHGGIGVGVIFATGDAFRVVIGDVLSWDDAILASDALNNGETTEEECLSYVSRPELVV